MIDMKRGMIAVALLAVACGDKGKVSAVCRREAADLGTLLQTMDHDLPAFHVPSAKLVTRANLTRAEAPGGPVAHVTAAHLAIEGLEVATLDPAALAEAFAEVQARNGRTTYHLVIDEDARWDRVAAVAAAAHGAGFTQPVLGFLRVASTETPPPRTPIDDELDALVKSEPGSDKATRLADMVAKVARNCRPLSAAFGSVAATGGQVSMADRLINSIEPAMIECNCNLDVPAFRSIMYRAFKSSNPTGSLQLTLAPEGTKVALPAATPWREAHAKLPAGPVWLE